MTSQRGPLGSWAAGRAQGKSFTIWELQADSVGLVVTTWTAFLEQFQSIGSHPCQGKLLLTSSAAITQVHTTRGFVCLTELPSPNLAPFLLLDPVHAVARTKSQHEYNISQMLCESQHTHDAPCCPVPVVSCLLLQIGFFPPEILYWQRSCLDPAVPLSLLESI